VELADTAGVRESGDALETAGVAGARRELETADVVVLVFDASLPWSAEDAAILSTRPDAIIVHNKHDLAAEDGGRPAGIMTCAISGEGLPALTETVVARIAPEAPAPGAAVPFTARQVEALHEARTRLEFGNPAEAAACLRKLVSSEPRS
jgi:tRNA modification GTPase